MIILNLEKELKKNNLNQKKLAKELGISEVSLSRKLNGNVSVTLEEVNKLCDVLTCTPGDILIYKDTSKKVLPIFMNYNGVGDAILKDEKYANMFFDLIKNLEEVTESNVKIIMVTCYDIETAKNIFIKFEKAAESHKQKNLFHSIICEYCGYVIEKETYEKSIEPSNLKITTLKTISPQLVFNRNKIEKVCLNHGLRLNNETYSYLNVKYPDDMDSEKIDQFVSDLKALFAESDIEVFTYDDEYSKDCDIKDSLHNEANAINLYLDALVRRYNVVELVICESLYDTNLYTFNINKIKELNIRTIHIKQDCDFDINKFIHKIINAKKS